MGMSRALRPLGWANLIANMALVVTGGVVRLTGSGLGCETWPRCTEDAFTPHGAVSMHSAIEFGNRLLTFVLAAIAIAAFVAAFRDARRTGRTDLRTLALIIGLGIPAQAVVGGLSVLFNLNPWWVSLHLLASLAIICVAVLFLWRLDHPARPAVAGPGPLLGWLTFVAAWLVLYIGTVVTGSGPHAGDERSPRNGLDPLELSQLHADAVFLFLGLSIAVWVVTRRASAAILLAVLAVQGYIGYTQYFTGLPAVLVGFHMFGAAVVTAVVTWVLLDVRETRAEHLDDDPAAAVLTGADVG